jgi:diguanylate cyclase (GGDEF)-like protein
VTHGTGGVLLWCDLDHFKDINDSLGHRTGDVFLKRVADAFRIEMRRGDDAGPARRRRVRACC